MSLAYSQPAPRITPIVALRDTAGITKRNLIHFWRSPEAMLIFIQPALILLLFRYVLGGAIKIPSGSYVDFLVPAIFLEAMLLSGMSTAIELATDLNSEIIDRFRSLPMARSAFLAGRTSADLVRSLISLVIMVGIGVAVGFRFHCSFLAAIAGLALVMYFGYAFSWINATIGLLTKTPSVAQVVAMSPVFILLFASPAIIPVDTMPGWLKPFANNQPFGTTVNALRGIFEGSPDSHWIWLSLAWATGIVVVFFGVSVSLYRTATSSS
jgi:ABC-2 type transport system permease protein/oleandomycin transport system permease protein